MAAVEGPLAPLAPRAPRAPLACSPLIIAPKDKCAGDAPRPGLPARLRDTTGRVPIDPHGIRRRPRAIDLFCGAGGASVGYHCAGFDVTGVDINPQPDYPFEFLHMSALDADLSPYEFVAASPPCFAFTSIIPEAQRREFGHRWDHPNLIPAIRGKILSAGKHYVMENVAGAHRELVDPVRLCGTMFDLRVFRHRLFESDAPIIAERRCDHRNCGLGAHSPKCRVPPADATLPASWAIDADRYVSPEGKLFRSFRSAWNSHRGAQLLLDAAFTQFYPVYGMTGQRGSLEDWQRAMGMTWTRNPRSIALAIPPAYSEYLGRQMLGFMGYTLDYPPLCYEPCASDMF